jgi:hypothetical protein
MAEITKYLEEEAQADERLYQRYGKPLETQHSGEYVAISREGRLIIGSDDIEVLKKAIADFGSGRFAFYRIGSKVLGRWRQKIAYLERLSPGWS